MTERPDENGQLTNLLRALVTSEPSEEFQAGARRRYLHAIKARDRRHALAGLAAAVVGLAVIAALLGSVVEPIVFVGWLAEAAADLARWTTGVGVVIDLVPPSFWASAILTSIACVLSLVVLTRARSWPS